MTRQHKPELPEWHDEKPETTAARVERQIKEAVLDGKLAPGAMLGSEKDLAAQFGVSRLPIREALGSLRALGVVEIRAGAGGARISEAGNPAPAAEAMALQLQLGGVTPREVFQAQHVMETAAFSLAVKVATERDFGAIEDTIAEAQRQVDGQGLFVHASLAVHQAMVDAAHNHVLSASMRALTPVLYRCLLKGTTQERARSVVAYHRDVLAAMRARDAGRVQRLLVPHLEQVQRHTEELFNAT